MFIVLILIRSAFGNRNIHQYLIDQYGSSRGYGTNNCNCIHINLEPDVFGTFSETDLDACPNLERIVASGSRVSGGIPSFFQNLTVFECDRCVNLGGTIPENAFGERLEQLGLSDCNLQGSIPDSLFESKDRLTFAGLQDNPGLNGTLPTTIGDAFNLEHLYFYATSLTGQIPSEIGLLTNLRNLSIDDCMFSGSTIPEEIGNMVSLEDFFVESDTSVGCSILRYDFPIFFLFVSDTLFFFFFFFHLLISLLKFRSTTEVQYQTR